MIPIYYKLFGAAANIGFNGKGNIDASRYNGYANNGPNATTFRFEFVDDYKFRLNILQNGSATDAYLVCDTDNNNSAGRWGRVREDEDLFVFSTNKNINQKNYVNTKLLEYDKLDTLYLKDYKTGNAFGIAGNGGVRSWDISSSDQTYVRVTINSPGIYDEVYNKVATDDAAKVRCCKGDFDNSQDAKLLQEVCNIQGLTKPINGEQSKCDVFMDTYCPSHLDDPQCGCWDTDREIKKLSSAVYNNPLLVGSLKSNVKCWLPKCMNGYQPYGQRTLESCKLNICTQQQNVTGSDNVLTGTSTQLICDASTGQPINAAPSNGSTGSTGGSDPTRLYYYIILFILFIAVIIIVIDMVISKKSVNLVS